MTTTKIKVTMKNIKIKSSQKQLFRHKSVKLADNLHDC